MKELPNDKYSEEAVIGAMLIDGKLAESFFMDGGQIEWFYNYPQLGEAIAGVVLVDNKTPNIIILKDKIGESKLEKLGGITFLTELIENHNTYGYKNAFDILGVKYKQRELIKSANILLDGVYSKPLDEVAEQAMNNINKALLEGSDNGIKETEDIINTIQEYISKNKGTDLLGYSWGNEFLDKYTGGIQKSKTYRIGAPSGVGKTNLVYETLYSLIEQGAKVMFVSLENSIETTYIKFLSSVQEINPNKLSKGEKALDYSYIRKHKDKLLVTDSIFDLSEIKRLILKNKPDVVILDYIGLVNIKGSDEKDLYQKYADEVKVFVQKNKSIAWIDLSNLNKDEDEEKIRLYKGFNGAAKLRNNTDVGIHLFYYKPFYEYKKRLLEQGLISAEDKSSLEGVQAITFLISKNRLGPDGVEEHFQINFNNGIRYVVIPQTKKDIWKNL